MVLQKILLWFVGAALHGIGERSKRTKKERTRGAQPHVDPPKDARPRRLIHQQVVLSVLCRLLSQEHINHKKANRFIDTDIPLAPNCMGDTVSIVFRVITGPASTQHRCSARAQTGGKQLARSVVARPAYTQVYCQRCHDLVALTYLVCVRFHAFFTFTKTFYLSEFSLSQL
jgi:hypothetical protein